jgi:hypothetical protein
MGENCSFLKKEPKTFIRLAVPAALPFRGKLSLRGKRGKIFFASFSEVKRRFFFPVN